jgi:hypothetical protein
MPFEGCPFVGLAAYRPDQAHLFFGRQKETLDALRASAWWIKRARPCGKASVSTPIEFSREVPDEKSLVGRVSVISRRVDRGSCFSAVGRDGVAAARLVG